MKSLETIWVYVDARAPVVDAIACAAESARIHGAALTLVGAVGRSEDRIFQTAFGHSVLRIVREERASWLRELELATRSSLPAGRVNSVLLDGEVPWYSVAAHAVEHRPDLLVASAGARGPSSFDSVTQHLFRKCPVPVWSVVPGSPASPRRVLVALDPGPVGSEQRRVAREVLTTALRVCAGSPVEMHVAHAWTLSAESLIRSRFGAESADELVTEQRRAADEELEELLRDAEAGPAVATRHVLRGEAVDAIPALADQLDIDLVVLGASRRTDLAGFLIGSSAEGIVLRMARSVLVVKPPDFVSPVGAAPPRDR